MLIGVDASRSFLKNRTGVEEYSYQVIKHLMDKLNNHQVVLYVRNGQRIDFDIPENWGVREIKFPIFWTQIGLAWELFFRPVDALFVPAHVVPIIHPKNTIVTIHGLEYEFCSEAYSFWERIYMRCSIKRSCAWAERIIAVSENTKKDLVNLYKVPEEKIEVVYEGCNNCHSPKSLFSEDNSGDGKYILFIGRIEERKNILGIIKAFEILKEKHSLPHKLILVGKPGFGYGDIKTSLEKSKFSQDIQEAGFVSEEEKWELLSKAEVFLFPSFYEGFGLPILEAQSSGVPVVSANVSSMPEIANGSAILVDPKNSEEIAEGVYKLISNKALRDDIIKKGHENVKRFSWEKCSKEIAKLLNQN